MAAGAPVAASISPRRAAIALTLACAVSACASVKVGQHVSAKDYDGSPRRIFVVNRLDSTFETTLPSDFATAITAVLQRCAIATFVYRPDAMELDSEMKMAAAVGGFKPDAVLNINQTRRSLMDGEVRAGSYLVTLADLAQKRVIWRGAIGVGASTRLLASRSGIGTNFADEIVRAMAGDAVIKTCPTFPEKT